jgi:tetratricopeptide (TPR) repeat protein
LSGNYLKSLQLAKQWEEKAKEIAKNKELAEKENDVLQQFLKKCQENDVDLSEVEKPRLDYETAMASKDYQSALAHIRKSKEIGTTAFIQRIGEVGDSVDALITLIQSSGGEAKNSLDILERSKERVVANDLEGAMKLAKNAYDLAERTFHELFSQLYSQAQEVIMQAKEIGDDVSIFDDQLSRAKSSLENQEYEACLSQIKDVLEGAGEDLKSQINSSISRAEELVAAGEELNADMSRVNSHMEHARTALASLKFKESLSYAKKAETDGETSITSRFQELLRETRESIKKMKSAKEDFSIPQQLFEQAQSAMKEKKYIEALHALNAAYEKANQAQFDAVLEVIQKARDRFVLAKKVGVDMTKAVMLLNTARDHVKLKKYEEAIDYAEQSRKEIDKSLEMFYKARDQIVELSKAVKSAADLGADPGQIKSLLAEARKSFETQDYARTVEIAQKGISNLKKIAHEGAMAAIDVSDKSIKTAKQIGADVTEAEGMLQKAAECASNENLMDCVSFAKASKEAADAAMTRVMSDRVQNIDQFVKGYSGEGLQEVPEMITRARQYVAAYEFDKANELLKEVTHSIENIGEAECQRIMTVASSKIDELRSIGGEVSDLEILLVRANQLLSRKLYEDGTARGREIIEQANEHINRLVHAEYSAVKDTIEDARTIGIEIEEAKIAIRDASGKIERQELGEAYAIIHQTKEGLNQRISRYDGIKGKIRHAEELISEAGRTKADVSAIARMLDAGKNSFSMGNLDEAETSLDKCIQEGERSLGMYLAARFILSSKEYIELAEANKIDADSAIGLLTKAKELMKLKNYEEALATAKRCDAEGRRLIQASISASIMELQRLLTDARNVGVDTNGPEKLAEKASELLKTARFVEALRCVNLAREDINLVKNLSSQAAIEIRVARNNLKDAETLDMDVGRAREFLDQAVEALTRHQYAIALELSKKSSETSSEITRNRIWGTLEKFKEKVEKAASEGLRLGMAERYVAEGTAAFKEGRYQDSLKLAMKCEMEMERAELQRDISSRAVEMAKKKLSDATAEGIRNDRLAELVDRATRLLEEGKYVDAMSAAIEGGDELHSMRESLDSCRIELSSVRERIERLKKVNIDTSESDEIVEMAQDYLSAHEFTKCRDALKRAAAKAASQFESSIKEVMDQNQQMIAKAKSMGIDAKSCEDLFEVARTSFSESLWDFASQQAAACRESCLQLISKKMTNLTEDLEKKVDSLKKYGASTKNLEDLIRAARLAEQNGDVAAAFQNLMEADRKVPGIEDSHRKYMDTLIAAESTVENLGKYGLSKREQERLVAMAEIEKDNDYDSAIELLAEALDTAKEQMETYSPDINGMIASGPGLQEAAEGVLKLTLKNIGKAMGRDISAQVVGDFQVLESPVVPSLKPNSEATIGLKLIPKSNGSVPIKITISSKRQVDGKVQTMELEDTVNVFPAGPPFKLGRSTETTRCISCQGRIKPGFDIVTCRCGGQLHLSCAKRTNVCPVCGQKYDL